MKFSLRLISRSVDLSGVDPATLVERITRSVAEVESVTVYDGEPGGVRAARILDVRPHDRPGLSVCVVDDGRDRHPVVSGAPNARPGLVTAYAPPGSRVAGREIREQAVHGLVSRGMLCSPLELGLTEDGSGLCELPEGTPPGEPLPAILPLADTVFEVENKSISHRPDLWGHVGMARELAAILRRPLRVPSGAEIAGPGEPPAVHVEAPDACPRYMAFRFSVPAIGASPLWLQMCLHRLGIRPIANVVDLTNFVMVEFGNPTHAFDARQIAGGRIVVRRARAGEVVETLDRTPRTLSPGDLLICDAEKPVALAGIMGLANSEIRDDTTECLLEVANFRPEVIRRSTIRLRLRTEASARFEKALDPDLAPIVCRRFAELLLETVPGSRLLSGVRDVDAGRPPLPVIETSASYINERLGTALPAQFIVDALEALEFGVAEAADGTLRVHVPGHRATKDISIPEDLVEEVGRILGYDRIEPSQPRAPLPRPFRDPTLAFHQEVRSALSLSAGLHEVQTYSFDPEPLLARIGKPGWPRVGLRNPLGSEATHLRSRMLPGLLAVLQRDRGLVEHLAVYEIGRVFQPAANAIPHQPYHLGVLLWEREHREWAEGQRAAVDRLKSVVGLLSRRLQVTLDLGVSGEPQPWLHPVRQAAVALPDGTVVGHVGALHPQVCDALQAGPFAAAAEIALDRLQAAPRDLDLYEPIVRVPPVPIDISLVVGYGVTHAAIVEALRSAEIEVLRRIDYVGTFTGDPIPPGSKSVTYRLVFQSRERTLSKDEVATLVDGLVAICAARFGATLRE